MWCVLAYEGLLPVCGVCVCVCVCVCVRASCTDSHAHTHALQNLASSQLCMQPNRWCPFDTVLPASACYMLPTCLPLPATPCHQVVEALRGEGRAVEVYAKVRVGGAYAKVRVGGGTR